MIASIFKKGDRVIYVGHTAKCGCTKYSKYYNKYRGTTGTVSCDMDNEFNIVLFIPDKNQYEIDVSTIVNLSEQANHFRFY